MDLSMPRLLLMVETVIYNRLAIIQLLMEPVLKLMGGKFKKGKAGRKAARDVATEIVKTAEQERDAMRGLRDMGFPVSDE